MSQFNYENTTTYTKQTTAELKVIVMSLIKLTLWLPWVTKTEFLLTISVQYQPDTGGVSDENKGKYQFGNN